MTAGNVLPVEAQKEAVPGVPADPVLHPENGIAKGAEALAVPGVLQEMRTMRMTESRIEIPTGEVPGEALAAEALVEEVAEAEVPAVQERQAGVAAWMKNTWRLWMRNWILINRCQAFGHRRDYWCVN